MLYYEISPKKPRSGQFNTSYLAYTSIVGYACPFCMMKFSVKCKVWPCKVIRLQEARPWPQFFQTHTQTFPELCSSTVPNFIEIGTMLWISIVDTHTLIELYILDEFFFNIIKSVKLPKSFDLPSKEKC
jgi:hypothetical protein